MHFRQRMAWLMVVAYLSATCGLVYYIFEINDQFNVYAVDHVERYHGDGEEVQESSVFSFLWHITDVPLAVWFVILTLPYLQVFCMLMACTKPEPSLSLAYLWPIYVMLRCRRLYSIARGRSPPKAVNSPIQNGYIVIDT